MGSRYRHPFHSARHSTEPFLVSFIDLLHILLNSEICFDIPPIYVVFFFLSVTAEWAYLVSVSARLADRIDVTSSSPSTSINNSNSKQGRIYIIVQVLVLILVLAYDLCIVACTASGKRNEKKRENPMKFCWTGNCVSTKRNVKQNGTTKRMASSYRCE